MLRLLIGLVCAVGMSSLAMGQGMEVKVRADVRVRELGDVGWEHAQKIWEWAEPGYQETKSSELLKSWLREQGFQIEEGQAGIPTAFTASYGAGTPVIAILGEYDALPGLAQDPVPFPESSGDKYYGHGCGHHLFGVASAMAAISLKERIEAGEITGTVRFYGCPAEEGGSAKVFLVRAGEFADVDAVLHWHPSSLNSAGDRSTLARIATKFRFYGKSAHAAGSPEQGRSALDAIELMNHATNLLREHVPQETRIHYIITRGGDAPNVVPNFAEVYYYVRHPDSQALRGIYARVLKCAEAAALATETRMEEVNEGGILEILPNNTLAEVTKDNLMALNDLKLAEADVEFALKLQATLDAPKPLDTFGEVIDRSGTVGMGSTDVGDVSWVVPTTGFTTACWVPGTPGHSWQAVACGKTDIAKRGMILAARTLTASAIDLFQKTELLAAAKAELARRLGERQYETLMKPDQKPPLDYRN